MNGNSITIISPPYHSVQKRGKLSYSLQATFIKCDLENPTGSSPMATCMQSLMKMLGSMLSTFFLQNQCMVVILNLFISLRMVLLRAEVCVHLKKYNNKRRKRR